MKIQKFNEISEANHLTEIPTGKIELNFFNSENNREIHSMDVPNKILPHEFDYYKSVASEASNIPVENIYVKMKDISKKNEDVDDSDIVGITTPEGKRRLPQTTNRRNQFFYDYYTGSRISGKSKYELSKEIFKLAQRNDELGILAQFMLQIEREGIVHDYKIKSELSE